MRFLSTDLQPIDGPREWTPAVVDLQVQIHEFENTSVFLNSQWMEVKARKLGGEVSLILDWPRLGPGHYLLECFIGEGFWSEPVIITSSKLGDDSWRAMVFDLQDRLTASIAIGLQRLGGLSGHEILEPGPVTLNAELNRIHQALHGDGTTPGLITIIPAVLRDPHTRLTSEDRLVRVHQARNMPPHLLPRSLRKLGADGIPERVVDRRQILSLNTYENQIVRLFLMSTQNRLLHIKSMRRHVRDRTAHIDEVIATLDGEMRRLFSISREWLSDVEDMDRVPTSLTMVILKRPEYRAAMEGYLRLHRKVSVRMDAPDAQTALENTPLLYQQWCSLIVIEQLVSLAADYGWKIERQNMITRDGGGLLLRLQRSGQPVLVLRHQESGRILMLTFEPSFSSTGEIQSLSFVQKPDIVLRSYDGDNDPHLLVLDPKYKLDSEDESPNTGIPLKVDIDKMHAYRDAIVTNSGHRAVSHAAILYPGQNVEYGPHISATQLLPGETEVNVQLVRILETFVR